MGKKDYKYQPRKIKRKERKRYEFYKYRLCRNIWPTRYGIL